MRFRVVFPESIDPSRRAALKELLSRPETPLPPHAAEDGPTATDESRTAAAAAVPPLQQVLRLLATQYNQAKQSLWTLIAPRSRL